MTTRIKLTHSKYLHEDEVHQQVRLWKNHWWTVRMVRVVCEAAERIGRKWAKQNDCDIVDGRVER